MFSGVLLLVDFAARFAEFYAHLAHALFGFAAELLGDLHGAELGPAHGAEMRDLVRVLGQGFVVEVLGGFGIEGKD